MFKRRNNTSSEAFAFESLKTQLGTALKGRASIRVASKDGFEFECDEVINHKGNKRADFVFRLKKQDQCYLSHKAAGFSHHGYGRLSHKTWVRNSHSASNAAMFWARQLCVNACYDGDDPGGLLKWPKSFGEGIWFHPSLELQNTMIFGREFGQPSKSLHNVDFLVIGTPGISPIRKGVISLNFDEGVYRNEVVPPRDSDHAPIVVVRNTDKRSDYFYTEKSPLKGMKADIGYFPLRLIKRKLAKAAGCIQVEYPSGKLLGKAPLI